MNNMQEKNSFGREIIINGTVFRMNKSIMHGSDSRIFVAHSLKDGGGPAFVIKCFRCFPGSDSWKKAMREIEAGKMLRNCPYIVHLKGSSIVKKTEGNQYRIYLLFERLQCLDNLRNIGFRTCMELCRDICLGLEFMRKKGLVHGDVKPQNIFFDGKKWMLGDLGSVCVSGEVPEYGSEGYISPEAFRGQPCDIRSDLYSLGITLYKTLSGGRLPFCTVPCEEADDNDVYCAIKRRLSGEEISELPQVNREINSLLLKLCRFDPHKRYKKPSAAAKDAQRLLSTAL